MTNKIQPLSYEQTQYLASLYHDLSGPELRDALEEFVCDYGYDESENDDMSYAEETVTYRHRSGYIRD